MNLYLMFLPLFKSVMGEVTLDDLYRSLELMGKGMLGILVVMALIFLVIIALNKTTGRKKKDSENSSSK